MNDITMIVIMLNGAMIARNDMGDRTQFIASSPFQLSFFHSSFLFFSISTWIQGSRIMYRKCEREGYNNQVKQIPITTTTTTVIQCIYAFLTTSYCITYTDLYIQLKLPEECIFILQYVLLLRLLRLSRLIHLQWYQ